MAGVHSSHVVLEAVRLECDDRISRYVECAVALSQQEQGSVEPAGAESDSGDSLFITQMPVPEPVRPRRRRHRNLRSDSTSVRDPEESEGSSSPHEEFKTGKNKRRKKYRLPKYSFPFLSERKAKPRDTLLLVHQNAKLHNYTIGGFFKCVRELCPGYQRQDDVGSSLTTVDMEGENISPLSEEEEDDMVDIKVVRKKCLVAQLKAKSQQTWFSQVKQQRRRKDGETSQGRQCETIPAQVTSSLDPEITDGGESCRVQSGSKMNGEHATSDGSILAQRGTSQTKTHGSQGNRETQQKVIEEELSNDSDATVCEPDKLQRNPQQCTQMGSEATEPQTVLLHIDDLSQAAVTEDEPESQTLLHSFPDLTSDTNDSVCNETKVRKRKKKKKERYHESIEEETGQSQEEAEGLRAARLSEDNTVEPLASRIGDGLECNVRNCPETSSHDDTVVRQDERDIPDSKKKKKKRRKSAAETVRQEVDGNLGSDVRMEESAEDGVKEKKKKRKNWDEDVELVQSNGAAQSLNNDVKEKMKKKKRVKEETIVVAEECEEDGTIDLPLMSTGQFEGSGHGLENKLAASEETSESSSVKRKKHKKEKRQSSCNDAAEGVDVTVSDGAVHLDESAQVSLKKKKREDNVTQNDDSVSRRKKKKKTSSFLVADAEEKDTQTHAEQKSPSLPVDAHVWGAEKAAVSASDFGTGSAETTGNSGEQNSRVRKKKKVSAEQESVEKLKETLQSALPETIDAGVKREKKHLGSENELSTLAGKSKSAADGSDSPTDDDVLQRKNKKREGSAPVATEDIESEPCSSVSRRKKGKHGCRADVSRTCDQANMETLVEQAPPSPERPGDQTLTLTLNGTTDKKKTRKTKSTDNVLLEGESAEAEPQEHKRKKRDKQSVVADVKIKRRLLNPNEEFLTV